MIGNELYEPLKGKSDGGGHQLRRFKAPAVLSLGAVLVAVVLVTHGAGGRGGEPEAVGTIEQLSPVVVAAVPETMPSAPAKPPSIPADPSTAPHGAGQSVEIQNGVKIYRPIFNAGPGESVIRIPPSEPEMVPGDADARLIEPGPYGPLPRVGPDGARPADVYARHSGPEAADARPKVALLIGGFGFDRAATSRAAATLPGAVTFGFAPYGEGLAAQVRVAREAGHEVVLQLPMEGSNKVEAPPTHMLTSDPARSGDDLAWLLSRFPGYAGVSNLLGSRILGNEAALRPVLETIAARGLYFLEDGGAARSLVETVGREISLSSSRADVVIDARSGPAAIDSALARLESLARTHGAVIATAIASPDTTEAIGRFASALAGRGVVLVPLSQAVRAKKTIIQGNLFRTP